MGIVYLSWAWKRQRLLAFQLGGDGKEIGAVCDVRYGITLIKLVEVFYGWTLVWHHLISSSPQGGGKVRLAVLEWQRIGSI